jgi:hypothetical protein
LFDDGEEGGAKNLHDHADMHTMGALVLKVIDQKNHTRATHSTDIAVSHCRQEFDLIQGSLTMSINTR